MKEFENFFPHFNHSLIINYLTNQLFMKSYRIQVADKKLQATQSQKLKGHATVLLGHSSRQPSHGKGSP